MKDLIKVLIMQCILVVVLLGVWKILFQNKGLFKWKMVNMDKNDFKEMLFERHFEYIYWQINAGKLCG